MNILNYDFTFSVLNFTQYDVRNTIYEIRTTKYENNEGVKLNLMQKIRIRLQAYDHRILDNSTLKIIDTVKKIGGKFSGPIPLPTEINKYCVLRSPHVDKKSREEFEMRTHKRLIDILEPSTKTIEALMHLDLPSGVDIEIKTLE